MCGVKDKNVKAQRGWKLNEYKKMLERNGFYLNRTSGDHFIYVNAEGKHISFPYKPNDMVYNRLVRENKLEIEE